MQGFFVFGGCARYDPSVASRDSQYGHVRMAWTRRNAEKKKNIRNGLQNSIVVKLLNQSGITSSTKLRSTQNLFHLPAFGQLIHQLIQIPNLLCQRIFDFLHTIPADYTRDEVRIGI
jgi:hypothetical protein